MNKAVVNFIARQAKEHYPRSLWFEHPDMNVYLRAGNQFSYTGSGFVLALTVSNVEVNENMRRRGIFTKFVMSIMHHGKNSGYAEFQIENAITPEMLAYCKKHEMNIKESPYGSTPSFWLDL